MQGRRTCLVLEIRKKECVDSIILVEVWESDDWRSERRIADGLLESFTGQTLLIVQEE